MLSIATGFQPDNSPVPSRRPVDILAETKVPAPEPVVVQAPIIMTEPEPEPVPVAEADPGDPDDLDTPAYLRQGRLLN